MNDIVETIINRVEKCRRELDVKSSIRLIVTSLKNATPRQKRSMLLILKLLRELDETMTKIDVATEKGLETLRIEQLTPALRSARAIRAVELAPMRTKSSEEDR